MRKGGRYNYVDKTGLKHVVLFLWLYTLYVLVSNDIIILLLHNLPP
jgi:hypothetical protein